MKPISTSASSPLQVDFLPSEALPGPGRIGMSIAPGKKDDEPEITWDRDLQVDLKRLREELDVDRLVCLLEPDEMESLEIPNLLSEAESMGIAAEHYPVPDHGVPPSMESFSKLVDQVADRVSSGDSILIHCSGGRGRTGMLAAACLVRLGVSPEDAIAAVRNSREGALKAAIKRDYVQQFANERTKP